MSNSVDPDEMLIEPSHLDLCYLQKPIIIACGSERVKEERVGCFCHVCTFCCMLFTLPLGLFVLRFYGPVNQWGHVECSQFT